MERILWENRENPQEDTLLISSSLIYIYSLHSLPGLPFKQGQPTPLGLVPLTPFFQVLDSPEHRNPARTGVRPSGGRRELGGSGGQAIPPLLRNRHRHLGVKLVVTSATLVVTGALLVVTKKLLETSALLVTIRI